MENLKEVMGFLLIDLGISKKKIKNRDSFVGEIVKKELKK